jgi:HEPN domain-containing protein
MPPEDLAVAMLTKAQGDARAMTILAGTQDTPNWIVGFHAQQAIEKALKAVLLAKGLDAPKIHDLEDLSRRVTEGGTALPVHPDVIASFTPWAAAGRYPDLLIEEQLDEDEAARVVASVLDWATPLVPGDP